MLKIRINFYAYWKPLLFSRVWSSLVCMLKVLITGGIGIVYTHVSVSHVRQPY